MRQRLKVVVFAIGVTTAIVLGLYSLYLAVAHAELAQPSNTADLLRTATASDVGKIETALGALADQDLVYVVLESAELGSDHELETTARKAARSLTDSGMAVAVRQLAGDPDFTTIVAQNDVVRFPAVLLVKKDGGIVLVSDDLNVDRLLLAYEAVWGKTSSCDEATSALY